MADLEEAVSAPERAGLAANQAGMSRRVFSHNVDGRSGHLVNPVIEVMDGEQEDDEGCLSLPGLWYPLRRARYARARGSICWAVHRGGGCGLPGGRGLHSNQGYIAFTYRDGNGSVSRGMDWDRQARPPRWAEPLAWIHS